MIAILAAKGTWVKRSEIMAAYDWKDSMPCRLGREGSRGRIIWGQQGYKLTRLAALQEIDLCAATILSQIKSLQADYGHLMVRRHKHE
jgi:hypothetical protein